MKRYVSEVGTGWVLRLCDPLQPHAIYIASITGAEGVSALMRRSREGSLSDADALTAISDFRYDLEYQYHYVDITLSLVHTAMDLAQRHPLKGYDAVQLAAALHIQGMRLVQKLAPLTFIASDRRLLTVASAEGLVVDDPNRHP